MGSTHKVEVSVVNGCFLLAIIENNKHRVDEIAGEADVGQRNPHSHRQNPVHKPYTGTMKTR